MFLDISWCKLGLILTQVLDSRIGGYGTLLTDYHHNSIIKFSVRWCVEDWGRISRSGLTQDIKMGICVILCDVQYQWIAQRQVGSVSLYCDSVGCHVLCLRQAFLCGSTLVRVPLLNKQGPSLYDLTCLKATLNSIKPNQFDIDSLQGGAGRVLFIHILTESG